MSEPARPPWVRVPEGSDFPIQNLPYGVFQREGARRIGVAIGDHVLDVAPVAGADGLAETDSLREPTLNAFMALGPEAWGRVRAWLRDRLTDPSARQLVEPHLLARSTVELPLPFEVADYVDFYSSEHHARNVGRLFRPGQEPLTPNWYHLPIAYQGRAGTVAVSGTPVVRPCGQRIAAGATRPSFGPSERLDIEAEVGFIVGVPSPLGRPVAVETFAEHVFGVCLLNDWSARDIQAWESAPLGPFQGKSFLTSVSPWIVPLAALAPARVPPPKRSVPLLPYLRDVDGDPWGLDIGIEVRLGDHVLSRPSVATMYWTPAQQLAHLTANGASVRTGDLFASGTVSGPDPDQWGSLLELSRGGEQPITLPDGSTRTFLADGDEVVLRATAPGPDGVTIGFGELRGRVLPAAPRVQ